MAEFSKSKKPRSYVRAGIVAISDVLPLILDPQIKSVVLHGHKVKVTSLRLRNFAKSYVCSGCKLEATHFAVESNGDWHLNLWANRGPDKNEMLFTHDHTLARSLGGKDDEENTSTMCAKCNFNKSRGEHAEYCRRNGLPMPGTKKLRKIEKGQSVAATAIERREENMRVRTLPLELAVRQFRKLERKAAEAA